jgi:hypothetical protein
MLEIISRYKNQLALVYTFFISAILHIDKFVMDLNGAHLSRQAQTQMNILSFSRYDFNILNPRNFNLLKMDPKGDIQRLEFPLMQWLIACINKLFGESIINTRIMMFLFGFLGVVFAFYLVLFLFKNFYIAFLISYAFCLHHYFIITQ